ncbi:hypothetical protein DV515_00001578 [Chloebia gouldiae]|uniref:Transmembrane protein 196 n=1 Tax=Chloebia gouldiae TaxID=44316 RepID=A0A3L8SXH7_CHLGU|nr:hypothetical protein DV515_00001578 [Chloebia gouldiae]
MTGLYSCPEFRCLEDNNPYVILQMVQMMILFSACCICGLIGGILNFQFLRALTKKSSALYSLHLASMSLACIGIGGCTLSSWLTCRLASYEQRRMFSEREHSLHHSHEMAEKRLRGIEITDLPSCPVIPPTPELPPRYAEH